MSSVSPRWRTLARAREGATWFDAGAWSEDLADGYLALGRVDGGPANVPQVMPADLRDHDLTDGQRTGAPGHSLGVLR